MFPLFICQLLLGHRIRTGDEEDELFWTHNHYSATVSNQITFNGDFDFFLLSLSLRVAQAVYGILRKGIAKAEGNVSLI